MQIVTGLSKSVLFKNIYLFGYVVRLWNLLLWHAGFRVRRLSVCGVWA